MFYNFKKIAKNIVFSTTPHIPFNRSLYLKNINYRKSLPFTAILELAKPISFLSAFTYERHISNEFYGHASTLKKYCGLPENYQFKFSIEHGAGVTKIVTKLDLDSPFQAIATSGKPQAKFLKDYKPYTFTLGPYIHYAQSLLSPKQIANEKKRLGKNLLVFPSHSTLDVKTTFDIKGFCKKIQTAGKGFDSVRICLYWKDALDGAHKIYKKYGFECVTAGHILDINFLPRLKSIIETSTATMSNDVGTQIGYCIALGKPHYLLKENFIFSGLSSEVNIVKRGHKDKNVQKTMELFKSPSRRINKNQFEFINLYWGLDQIKSRRELLDIINLTEKMYHEKQQ